MKKPRQRRLRLNFVEPLHPVTYDRGKLLLAKMRETLAQKFGERKP